MNKMNFDVYVAKMDILYALDSIQKIQPLLLDEEDRKKVDNFIFQAKSVLEALENAKLKKQQTVETVEKQQTVKKIQVQTPASAKPKKKNYYDLQHYNPYLNNPLKNWLKGVRV
jgi:dsDNA-binding SOS-regulon protein